MRIGEVLAKIFEMTMKMVNLPPVPWQGVVRGTSHYRYDDGTCGDFFHSFPTFFCSVPEAGKQVSCQASKDLWSIIDVFFLSV